MGEEWTGGRRLPEIEACRDVSMVTAPLLSDFAIRLAFGLIAALTLTSWRQVPLRFFRIQALIALGLIALATASQTSLVRPSLPFWMLVVAGVAVYLASATWGLGLPSVATAMDVGALLAMGAWMVLASRASSSGEWALATAGRAASGLLLGATLHSMLLGHYYLTAPSMTIAPLTRSLDLILAALIARCVLDGVGAWVAGGGRFDLDTLWRGADPAIVAMRWGMGVLGAGVSVYLARRTAAIRSTQSATGILYITTIFVLFGELAALAAGAPGVGGR